MICKSTTCVEKPKPLVNAASRAVAKDGQFKLVVVISEARDVHEISLKSVVFLGVLPTNRAKIGPFEKVFFASNTRREIRLVRDCVAYCYFERRKAEIVERDCCVLQNGFAS